MDGFHCPYSYIVKLTEQLSRHRLYSALTSGRRRSARTEKTLRQSKDLSAVKSTIRRPTGLSLRYHGRCLTIVCPGLFVRTCVWNVSSGAVHRSWKHELRRLLARSARNFCFRTSLTLPSFGATPPTVSEWVCRFFTTRSGVYTKKLTLLIWWILSSYCLTAGNRNSMFCTIYVFPNSA